MSWCLISNASFLGYLIVHRLLVWFIVPLRDCNLSFTKLWLQATACNLFNTFGWFRNCFISLPIKSWWWCELLWPEHSQATGVADTGKGEFQGREWAPSGVGLFTQGHSVKTAQLHYARVGAFAFSHVPQKNQAGLKLWPRSESFCSPSEASESSLFHYKDVTNLKNNSC